LISQCDPYCKVVGDGSKEERKTTIKRSTYAPVWNEVIMVPWPLPGGDLTLDVMDWFAPCPICQFFWIARIVDDGV